VKWDFSVAIESVGLKSVAKGPAFEEHEGNSWIRYKNLHMIEYKKIPVVGYERL